MSQLIVHVGPPKCGSSSIQNFLGKAPCKERIRYINLGPETIDSFNKRNLNSKRFYNFTKRINNDLKFNDCVILSQEYLFGNTTCIENICNVADTEDIKIIGYSRKQSSFLISAFSQWEFRSINSNEFYSKILIDHKINSCFFTGLEGFLISVILSDFEPLLTDPRYRIYNWNFYYQQIEKSLPNYDVVVNCLPSKSYSYNLIEDFCTQSNITIKKNKQDLSMKRENIKFDSTLTESMYCALTNDMKIPDEHSYNNKLNDLSFKLGMNYYPQTKFLKHLSDYIDTYFFPSNMKFCQRHSIPIKEFEPSQKISKEQVQNLIIKELNRRRKNPEELLIYYKELLGKWGQFSYNSLLSPQKENIIEKILRKINLISSKKI